MAHRCPVDGKVHVVHHRALFDLGRSMASRTVNDARCLLDHQANVGTTALITQDAHVLQTHECLEDLSRVDKDECASCFLAHTSSLKRLRLILGDFGNGGSPLKSEEPDCLALGFVRVRVSHDDPRHHMSECE
jgi:hypothetical protein